MTVHGLILTDNTFSDFNYTINRGSGAHRIASHLRTHGYNVEVVDYCLRWTLEEFQELCFKIISDGTLFLGIGSNLFYDRESFNQLIKWFKLTYPKIPTVLGGNNTLGRNIPYIDYLIDGYAENAMPALLDYLKGNISKLEVKWDLANGTRFINAYQSYAHIDTSDLSINYLPSDFIDSSQSLGLETARGCIFKCTFCTYPLIGKKKFDYLRNPKTITDELKRNYDQWGTTRYVINEDTFNDNIEKLEILEKAITSLPFKIEFVSYARLDLILAKKESVELLRNMGMRGVHFGIETFNHEAGKIIRKGWHTEKLKDGLLWWKEVMPDVTTHCSLIVGLPNDTDNHFNNADWLASSGIESWNWSPLYINNLNKTLHPSEFSKTYHDYGLDKMTDDEISQELELEAQHGAQNVRHQNFISKTHRDRIIYWKNSVNGDNYFKCVRLATELHQYSKTRKTGPWLQFDWCGLGYDLDTMRSWGWHDVIPHVPEIEVQSRADKKIADYKKNKIKYDYNSYYKN